MEGLTKRQREIIDFIENFLSEKRYSPSFRDIQNHFAFSSLGSVYNHVQSLKKKGFLSQNSRQSRSLSVLAAPKAEGTEVPLIGELRGGMPIETYPQVSRVLLPVHMVPDGQAYYLLRVVGRELEEEWIKEGDLLLVHSKSHFEDHEMVLAQVGKQTTCVKKAIRTPPYICLESENPEVQPMMLREEHIHILGTICSLLRTWC